MNIKEIKELVEILENSTLGTLEVSEDGKSIRLEKAAEIRLEETEEKVTYESAQTVVIDRKDEKVFLAANGEAITSPMVGVFYSKPSPGEEAYVSVGTHVKKGQTLCIIEAMKLMNEITAEKDGEIKKICASDGDLIEFGQELFFIA